MQASVNYVAKEPDKNGLFHYTNEENRVWHDLYERQINVIKNRACREYCEGIEKLAMPQDRIPQCHEMSAALRDATGWAVEPVPALIPDEQFFSLLAHKKFPAATFIRRRDEFDYLQEPDLFHEFFGHCPLLTEPACADFMQRYGEIAVRATQEERKLLGRLYWFTIEFGLIKTAEGLRIYGGGILSSPKEAVLALEGQDAERKPFVLLDVLRTPFRIDIVQPIYYVIDDYRKLYDVINTDIIAAIHQAQALGEFEPLFSPH